MGICLHNKPKSLTAENLSPIVREVYTLKTINTNIWTSSHLSHSLVICTQASGRRMGFTHYLDYKTTGIRESLLRCIVLLKYRAYLNVFDTTSVFGTFNPQGVSSIESNWCSDFIIITTPYINHLNHLSYETIFCGWVQQPVKQLDKAESVWPQRPRLGQCRHNLPCWWCHLLPC